MQNLILYHKNTSLPSDLLDFIKSEVKQEKYRNGMYTTYPNFDICEPLHEFYNRLIKRALFGLTLLHADFKQNIWAQIYEKGSDGHHKHNHHSVDYQLSWVHFIRTPDKKCFRFTNGFVPPQDDGDFVLFPSWAIHQIQPHSEKDDRIVVVGNVSLTNAHYADYS